MTDHTPRLSPADLAAIAAGVTDPGAGRRAAARASHLNIPLPPPPVPIPVRRVSRIELAALRWGRHAARTVGFPAAALVLSAAAGAGSNVAVPVAGGVWVAAVIMVSQFWKIIRRR